MCAQHLRGRTVLLIEPDLEQALDLQDCLSDEGATVVTAYRQDRAMELVQRANLFGAIVNSSVYQQNADLRTGLCERSIPHVVRRASEPVAAIVGELTALLDVSRGPSRVILTVERQPVAPLVVNRAERASP